MSKRPVSFIEEQLWSHDHDPEDYLVPYHNEGFFWGGWLLSAVILCLVVYTVITIP